MMFYNRKLFQLGIFFFFLFNNLKENRKFLLNDFLLTYLGDLFLKCSYNTQLKPAIHSQYFI